MRAREIMSSPVICVRPDLLVTDASKLLADRGFTALPVTDDDGHLIGIVTEADLIRNRIPADPRIHGLTVPPSHPRRPATVGEVMTTSVESLTPGADVADLARMMLQEHIRCFPIVDGDELVGVITRRDLLRTAIARTDADLQRDVAARLETMDEPDRWRVTVQAGVAEIEDFMDSANDRVSARAMATSTPGIVDAVVRHVTSDPF